MVASARAHPAYSLIVPVRDRPEGIGRLLVTLRRQTVQGVFELVLVEDGSARPATVAVESHKSYFPIRHEFLSAEKGIGPAGARNRGAALAKGRYLVFVDSDVRLPDDYLYRIDKHLKDCPDGVFFGGNDDVVPSGATFQQRAMHHAMTSWLSTGGIRGHRKGFGRFHPRTHNMVVKREVFQKMQGFREDFRYGEDIEFAIRMEKQGYAGEFLSTISVSHERKDNFKDFFMQVYHSGRARVFLTRLHPGSSTYVHYLPAIFCILLLFYFFFRPFVLSFFFVMGTGLVLVDACIRQRSFVVALLSVGAVLVQGIGYGLGFLSAQLGLGQGVRC